MPEAREAGAPAAPPRPADGAGTHLPGPRGAAPAAPAAASSGSGGGGGGRDRYLDLLRALALVRVVVYHTFGWAWLTLLFPSIGIMFALAGSLAAHSLQRPALSVVRGRLRRLLVPFWLFAAAVTVLMLLHGWRPHSWHRMLLWILPLADPPGTAWAEQIIAPLWYIRTYLWLVLLSPWLLKAFRAAPRSCLTACGALVVLAQYDRLPLAEPALTPVVDLVTFAACWLLGFAHRDGLLDALRARTVVAAAALCLVAGGWFAYTHPTDEGIDLGEIPLAQALWSAGFVLLLLRFRPRRMRRVPGADGAVGLLNARAVTVYLWHEVALFASVPLIDLMWDVPFFEAHLPLDATWFQFLVVWPLIGAAVVLVGWTEDLASRRRPRLWPAGGRKRGRRARGRAAGAR
ncbi:acyltransferase family protein [Actinacidiphila glaucinigra]|uniref:Peptidoglycan/LPS O-acetylase OafA/YrhL, contains acyltransferase and SGNH-hydrolase domains n=1 Tax=Actinacidiphila glaucinigra TaxID=235986 RepID=A0A238ZFX8_9ACTN|nr:acyltransferase [Actinacidiphila glaucinigra]SNR82415.1 Peptidoglycan/LPS O-acetylase OafA/YrhL, contains acyltransferase and SGNH-hydrolase domains [Actinacidiphila glaucinigra]